MELEAPMQLDTLESVPSESPLFQLLEVLAFQLLRLPPPATPLEELPQLDMALLVMQLGFQLVMLLVSDPSEPWAPVSATLLEPLALALPIPSARSEMLWVSGPIDDQSIGRFRLASMLLSDNLSI